MNWELRGYDLEFVFGLIDHEDRNCGGASSCHYCHDAEGKYCECDEFNICYIHQ